MYGIFVLEVVQQTYVCCTTSRTNISTNRKTAIIQYIFQYTLANAYKGELIHAEILENITSVNVCEAHISNNVKLNNAFTSRFPRNSGTNLQS